jgi:hypothetical protein
MCPSQPTSCSILTGHCLTYSFHQDKLGFHILRSGNEPPKSSLDLLDLGIIQHPLGAKLIVDAVSGMGKEGHPVLAFLAAK